MERAGAARDWFEVSGLDRSFHRAMVDAAGNSVLTELYDTLRSRQQRVAVRALTARPERLTLINSEHRALVAALDEHDEAEATRILHQHLRPVSEALPPSRWAELTAPRGLLDQMTQWRSAAPS